MTFAVCRRLGWPARWSAGALSLPGYPPGAGCSCRPVLPGCWSECRGRRWACVRHGCGRAPGWAWPPDRRRRSGSWQRHPFRPCGFRWPNGNCPSRRRPGWRCRYRWARCGARRRHFVPRWPPSPVAVTASPVAGCCRRLRSASPISLMRARPVSPCCPPCSLPAVRAGYLVGWQNIPAASARRCSRTWQSTRLPRRRR